MTDEIRDELKYTESHEWVKLKGDKALIGITDHAQGELTDIVFVELPEIGKELKKGDELCIVESVKSVSEIYTPISGKVIAVNDKLEDSPETINDSPYDDGWIVELEITNKAELEEMLSPEDYKKSI